MTTLRQALMSSLVVLLSSGVHATEQDHGSASLMKNIRSLIGNERQLQEDPQPTDPVDAKSVIRCFEQCVLQAMTAEECQAYIEELLGGPDLPDHEIPGLGIKINRPRPPDVISATYWMIGIPVNIYGEVDCEINGGNITYPWDWEVSEGVFLSIPDTPCTGLDAVECCDKVLANVEDAGIPLVDKNGNCLSCWVHQEPLEPVISNTTGEVAYLECSADSAGLCTMYELNVTHVQEVDDSVEVQVAGVQAGIDDILSQNPVNCAEFIQLHRDMLLYGRAFPNAMSKISGLLCGICEDPNESYVLTQDMIFALNFIKVKLNGEINSDENCIIIYTDHQGLVLEPPKVGGSRVNLDWDRDDPDCDDINDDKPRPPSGGDNPALAPVTPPTPTCVPPEVLDPSTGACICPDPDFVEDSVTGECVCANAELVFDPDTGVCVCPDTNTPPPPGETCAGGQSCVPPKVGDFPDCVCEAPLVENQEGVCKCPGEYAVLDPIAFTCSCPDPLIEDTGTGDCVCPDPDAIFRPQVGKCRCNHPKEFDTTTGTCQCIDPLVEDPVTGECSCVNPETVFDPDTGVCLCPDGSTPDAVTGCAGGNNCPFPQEGTPPNCVCPAPLETDPVTGECVCKDADAMIDPSTGDCVCPDGSSPDDVLGCGGGSSCVPPKVGTPPDCQCPEGTTEVLGECVPSGQDCPAPKVPDGNGNCVCPKGSKPNSDDVCVVPCTIQDVIDQYGTDGPCGTPYTECLEDECGPFWSPECLALLAGTSPEQNNPAAWMACLMTDNINPSGSDGKYKYKSGGSKYKSGSSKYKSGGSKYKSGGSKYKSGGSKYKSGSKGERRVVRQLKSKGSKGKSKGSSKYKSGSKSKGKYKTPKTSGTSKYKSPAPTPGGPNPQPPSECALKCEDVGQKPVDLDPISPGSKYKYKNGGGSKYKNGGSKYKNGGSKYKSGGSKYKSGGSKYKSGSKGRQM